VDLAEKQIDSFHDRFNSGDFAGIYSSSSGTLKIAMTEDEVSEKLSAMKLEHGNFVSASLKGWRTSEEPGGTWSAITYNSKYERGVSTEQFVYRTENGDAKLYGYYVNAKALVRCPGRGDQLGGMTVDPYVVQPTKPMDPAQKLFTGIFACALIAYGLYALVQGNFQVAAGRSGNYQQLSGWMARVAGCIVIIGAGVLFVDQLHGLMIIIGVFVLAWLLGS
jgi:hypothetical protein